MPLAPASLSLGSANPLVEGSAAPGTSPLASHQDHVHPSGGGGGITDASAVLASDVTVSATANTFTTILTLSNLAAGTWHFHACTTLDDGTIGGAKFTFRIHNGTSGVGSQEFTFDAALSNNDLWPIHFMGRDTPGGTTTYTFGFASTSASSGGKAKAAAVDNGQGNNATRFWALKVA